MKAICLKVCLFVTVVLGLAMMAPRVLTAEEAMADPSSSEAVVYTEVLSGDPAIAGGTFTVAVGLRGNTAGAIGTYSYRFVYDSEALEIEGVEDGADGFDQPPSIDTTSVNTPAFSGVNARSTLENGKFCVFYMRNKQAAGEQRPFNIELAPYGNTPLVRISDFSNVDHRIDYSATTNLGGVVREGDEEAGAEGAGGAVIATELEAPEGVADGKTISVLIKLRDNTEDHPVGTYALEITYTPDSLEFVAMRDGELGASPSINQDGPTIKVSAFNAQSTLVNGTLCIADFKVKDAAAERIGVMVQDLPSTPLMSVQFAPIAHTFEQNTSRLTQ